MIVALPPLMPSRNSTKPASAVTVPPELSTVLWTASSPPPVASSVPRLLTPPLSASVPVSTLTVPVLSNATFYYRVPVGYRLGERAFVVECCRTCFDIVANEPVTLDLERCPQGIIKCAIAKARPKGVVTQIDVATGPRQRAFVRQLSSTIKINISSNGSGTLQNRFTGTCLLGGLIKIGEGC